MMRCLFVHQGAELYGSDRVLLELVTTLRQRGSCEPIVVVPEDGALVHELRRRGIEVHFAEVIKVSRAMFRPRGLLGLLPQAWRSQRQIARIVAGRQIDLVHSNTLAVLGGAWWALLNRKPHVWHVHEIIFHPRLVAEGFSWLLRLLADRIVAISRMTLQNYVERQPRLAERGTIIWNGLATPPAVPEDLRRHTRAQLGFGEHDVVVGMLGRINHLKGHGLLLQAASLAARQRPDLPLRYLVVGNVFRGQEHFLTQFMEQRRQLGLEAVVTHLDFVDNVWPIWSAVDVGVVPSTEPEGFGMVAIEAMAMGKPVVAAAHGGVLDIVVDGTTGRLVPPRDAQALASALIELAEDGARRQQMGEAGRQRVAAEFSMDAQARKFEDAYRQTLQDAR